MGYVVKTDGNGRPIPDCIERIYMDTIPTTAVGTFTVELPTERVYQVVFKRVPVDATFSFNGFSEEIPIDEGEVFGVFQHLKELVIDVKEVGSSPIVVLLFT